MNIKNIYLPFTGLVFAFLMYGCAGYGKVKLQSGAGDKVTVQALIENSGDYNIYYSGYSTNNPFGVMFDPKKDDKTLTPSKGWTKVKGQEIVSKIVSEIRNHAFSWYTPRVYRIFDPDDQFYGYLFTGRRHVVAKVVDKKTLFVHRLSAPPQYYGPNGRRGKDDPYWVAPGPGL